MGPIRHRSAAWLLAALFLWGQAVALAHEFGHHDEAAHPETHCVKCLSQSVFDGKAAIARGVVAAAPVADAVAGHAAGSCRAPWLPVTRARSPPTLPI